MEALARRAVALDSSDAAAHSSFGLAMFVSGDTEGATDEIERGLALSPNLAIAQS
jgi:Flp pilus assembly protein TadD